MIFICIETYWNLSLNNLNTFTETSHTFKSKYLMTSFTVNMRHTIQSENFGDGQSRTLCDFVRNSNDIYLVYN